LLVPVFKRLHTAKISWKPPGQIFILFIITNELRNHARSSPFSRAPETDMSRPRRASALGKSYSNSLLIAIPFGKSTWARDKIIELKLKPTAKTRKKGGEREEKKCLDRRGGKGSTFIGHIKYCREYNTPLLTLPARILEANS
jgi:hypothetical protein